MQRQSSRGHQSQTIPPQHDPNCVSIAQQLNDGARPSSTLNIQSNQLHVFTLASTFVPNTNHNYCPSSGVYPPIETSTAASTNKNNDGLCLPVPRTINTLCPVVSSNTFSISDACTTYYPNLFFHGSHTPTNGGWTLHYWFNDPFSSLTAIPSRNLEYASTPSSTTLVIVTDHTSLTSDVPLDLYLPSSNSNSFRRHFYDHSCHQPTYSPICSCGPNSLRLRVHDVPKKSRVETQVKLKLELVDVSQSSADIDSIGGGVGISGITGANGNGVPVKKWSYVKVPKTASVKMRNKGVCGTFYHS